MNFFHCAYKLVTLAIAIFSANLAIAQITNPGFETWVASGNYNSPAGWGNLNALTSSKNVYTCVKGTPGSPGTAYLKLTSKTVSGMGVVPGVAVSGEIDPVTKKAKSGFAMAQRPTSLTGKWQHMAYGSDNGFISVYLTRWNSTTASRDTIGSAKQNLGAMVMSWANFSIPITYNSISTPDSCIITLSASGAIPVNSSYLYVDNLAFVGTVSDTIARLPIPGTLSGAAITLNLHQDSVAFWEGQKTKTLGINEYPYLGPTLVLEKGQQISLTVNNNIGEMTNVHWHGLHVSPENDGPHAMLMDGDSWNPQFTVLDRASTYWYHPHVHGKTALHVIKGIAGMIIVHDSAEAALALPTQYGEDDFPVIFQSIEFDSVHQSMPRGMEDSILLVNGVRTNEGHQAVLDIPAQVVRLRLLNASGERTFNIGLSDNTPFYVIASDGGLLAAPVLATRIRISPGERYQILVDATGMTGNNLTLMSYASELPMGVQGGPTMPMPPGSPSMDSPLNGVDFPFLNLHIVDTTSAPIKAVPMQLATVTPWQASQANTTRTITMSAQNMMVMDGPFYFNGQLFDPNRIDYTIPLNNIEIWSLSNQTMVAHPFHLHDVQFYVLDRDGIPVTEEEQGRKDIVLVHSMETVRFIAKFETFADTSLTYVYHCHVLMHEDDGMMGQFLVVPQSVSTDPGHSPKMSIFPNPAQSALHIRANAAAGAPAAKWTVKVLNTLGQTQFQAQYDENQELSAEIPCSDWENGVYLIEISQGDSKSYSKIIKQ